MSAENTNAGGGEPVTILYTNWRGETAVRRIDLSSLGDKSSAVGTLWYGSTQWHPEPQHFLTTLDVDKEEWRDFAMSGIKAWGQEAVDAALSAQSTGSAGVAGFEQVPLTPETLTPEMAVAARQANAAGCQIFLMRTTPPAGGGETNTETTGVAPHSSVQSVTGEAAFKSCAVDTVTLAKDAPFYQFREMGEGEGWQFCSKAVYDSFQSDPRIDTREVPASQVRPAAHSPASPAGDLISLSAVLARFAACVFNDNGDVTISTANLVSADWLALDSAYRSGRLVEAAPAAPRKGPTEEEIARALYEHDVPEPRFLWPIQNERMAANYRSRARAIAALLTPADRGETQAVDESLCPVPDRYDMGECCGFNPCIAVPDQNRGEPDQGGANTEAGR